MQAIILAAGMGKRLGNLTKDNTKCMVKVNGIPLIDRVLGQLSHFPLSKVILVIGYKGEKLKEYLGFDYQGLPIQYIENSIYDKTNNIYSLSLAKKELQEEYLQPIITQYFIDNKSEIWLLFLIAHSKR